MSPAVLVPGLLVAATGVGAGDLLTAGLGGSIVGVQIVWAASVGALLKWFLNEGIARWQMATGSTLLEGWAIHLGRWIRWLFLLYLLPWTLFTGGALVSACGVAGTGLCPVGNDPRSSRVIWGVIHSMLGLILVFAGGFKLFGKLMAVLVGMMFALVLTTAILIQPDWSAVMRSFAPPVFPAEGAGWMLGILGGVGGTVTLLSYGYWIREAGRTGLTGVRTCRLDLAVGYAMTALFGTAMIIIGSRVELDKGAGGLANVALSLADQLAFVIGPAGRWLFLVGFWSAVFSSLLGVWQSVPYLFADFLALGQDGGSTKVGNADLTKSTAYRVYLIAIAVVPLPLLAMSVTRAQLCYAIMGSLFMPFLALTLLIMNNRTSWVKRRYRNGWVANIVLVATLLFFLYMGCAGIAENWERLID